MDPDNDTLILAALEIVEKAESPEQAEAALAALAEEHGSDDE
jgi:hypothetical protein